MFFINGSTMVYPLSKYVKNIIQVVFQLGATCIAMKHSAYRKSTLTDTQQTLSFKNNSYRI